MLLLTSTSDKVQVITGQACTVDVHASWMDNVSGAVQPGRTNTPTITSAVTTTVVGSPAAGAQRNIKTLHVRNRGTAIVDITVQHTDGTTVAQLYKTGVRPGETLQYTDEVGFSYTGVNVSSGLFSTGDAKLTLKTTADSGWIMMDDGTFGNLGSGSSNRSNSDTQNLFNLLYNNISDDDAPLYSSAGAATTRAAQGTAATAFTNNCRMALTKQLGRAIAIAGSGAGLTARTLGHFDGAETHAQSGAELANHYHTAFGYNYMYTTSVNAEAGSSQWGLAIFGPNTEASGGSAPASIMSPRSYWNVMIKL
jgi:hypothetical protein